MKLTNQQVSALSSKIYNEIRNEVITLKRNIFNLK